MAEPRVLVWKRFAPALVMFVAACGFMVWAQTYRGEAGAVPGLVAWLTLALTALDLIASTETVIGRYLHKLLSGVAIENSDKAPGKTLPWQVELAAIAWISGFVAAVALVGFYVVLPIFITLYMVVQGRRSWRTSLLSAGITSLVIYLVFELLWSYNIYRGWLFE